MRMDTILVLERMRKLAAQGFTRDQAAERLGLGYGRIVRLALDHGIVFKNKTWARTKPNARHQQILNLRRSGQTLQQIGEQFDITRERVRQILKRWSSLEEVAQ